VSHEDLTTMHNNEGGCIPSDGQQQEMIVTRRIRHKKLPEIADLLSLIERKGRTKPNKERVSATQNSRS
jgi:hypothetical protein